jgi:hypothetical protein
VNGMRYRKGGIDLKSPQDTFMLQTILRARHISHEQLWRFVQCKTGEDRRRMFNWRLKRLVDHELVDRRAVGSRSSVYSIAHDGAEHLVGLGESAALVVTGGLVDLNDRALQHSLDLNEIHLSLLEARILTAWQSDLEIRSINEFTDFGFAKDYDAVAKIERARREYQIAIEYERTPKARERYAAVRRLIEGERRLDCVLYLTPAYPLLAHVAKSFERCTMPVFFALIDEFQRNTLETMVMDGRRLTSFPLSTVLDGGARRSA